MLLGLEECREIDPELMSHGRLYIRSECNSQLGSTTYPASSADIGHGTRPTQVQQGRGTCASRQSQEDGTHVIQIQAIQWDPESQTDQIKFLNSITLLQTSIMSIDDNINCLAELHRQSLASAANETGTRAALEELMTHLRTEIYSVKTQIQILSSRASKMKPSREQNMQQAQLGAVKARFKDSIQRYQEMEQGFRQKYRARAERQFRIVKPDATPQEVREVLDTQQSDTIFSQALVDSSRRFGEARGALREVRDRQVQIRKIEESIAELSQLFVEVDILLDEQDSQLDAIVGHAQNIEKDMKEGLECSEKAVQSAEKARKRRMWCFWFVVCLILLAAISAIGIICGNYDCSGFTSNQQMDAKRASEIGEELKLLSKRHVRAMDTMARDFGAIV